MVNAVRTLLVNLDGHGCVTGDGEEYTDPQFRAVSLPSYLQVIRAVLFGAAPDRRTVLYRTRQFLAVIHAANLAEFVTVDDPRLTYLPLARGGFELPPQLVLSPIGGHAYVAHLTGPAPGQDTAGKTDFTWTLTVTE
jgi:hypothetical protein